MPSLARLDKNKKGIFAYEAVMWIVRTLMLVFVLLSVMFVTSAFIIKKVDTRLVESYVLEGSMYYSPNAISLRDAETGRTYPGVVNRLNSGRLEQKFNYNEGEDGPFITSRATIALTTGPKEFFYLEEVFNDWNFLYLAGLTEGLGGVKKLSAAKRLVITESGKERMADVKLEVVTKNA